MSDLTTTTATTLKLTRPENAIYYISNRKAALIIQLMVINEENGKEVPANLSGVTSVNVVFAKKTDPLQKETLEFLVYDAPNGVIRRLTEATDFAVTGNGMYAIQVTMTEEGIGRELSSIPTSCMPELLDVRQKL